MIILSVAVWSLIPPSGNSASTVRLGTDPSHLRDAPPSVKYKLRIYPLAYLPGTMPDNVGKPLSGINKVAAQFEKLYPDTRVAFVSVPGGMREWLVTQLSSGDAPDIVSVNVEDIWQDVQKHWYIPLDRYLDAPNPFIPAGKPGSRRWWDLFKYQIPTRGKCAPDGHFYCITLDMLETGVFYNKDIFHRLGLHPPKDWPEFLKMQQHIKEAGYTPMLVNQDDMTDWAVDLTFYQVYNDISDLLDLRYDPRSGAYLKDYLDWDEIAFLHSKGFFSPTDPRWVAVWPILKRWRQYMPKHLGTGEEARRTFITQQGAMLWSSSMLVNMLSRDPDIHFKWGVFYLPPIPRSFNKFCNGHDQCVIGGSDNQFEITNSAIKDTDPSLPFEQRIEKSERLKRAVAFLQLLTTPRNADTVVNEMDKSLPNVVGCPFQKNLAPFDKFLQRHYTMTKWYFTFDNQFDEVFARMFHLYLNGGLSESEWLDWMERNLNTACKTAIERKHLDLAPLQEEWDKRAEMRKTIKDLPPGAYP